MNNILKTMVVCAGCVASSFVTLVMSAQVIVPAAKGFSEPGDFTFHGEWVCSDKGRNAYLSIGLPTRNSSTQTLRSWTELQEHEDWFKGNYLVGYDHDRNQLLLIDKDDPTAIAYSTAGWHGRTLTLTLVHRNGDSFPPYRLVYNIKSPGQFSVRWEILDAGHWSVEPESLCVKTEPSESVTGSGK